jgi:hypothetical protein
MACSAHSGHVPELAVSWMLKGAVRLSGRLVLCHTQLQQGSAERGAVAAGRQPQIQAWAAPEGAGC